MPRSKKKRRAEGPCRRFWCATENNPTEDHWFHRFETESRLPKGFRYIAFQLEQGEKETPHYQIYIELLRDRRLSWLKRHISKTAHWEPRNGTAAQASLYCTSEEYKGKDKGRIRGPWTLGKISKGAGTRSDLVDFKDAIKSGKRKRDLWETHTVQMAKYRHMYDDYNRCHPPTREEKPIVCLLFGKTGKGKTRTVHETWKEEGYWRLPVCGGRLWFDGYDGHKNVLLDDFNGKMSKVGRVQLLQILDRYVVQVEVKCSFVWWHPENIAVTSNYHPREWYKWNGDDDEGYHALARRFDHVIEFTDVKVIQHDTEEEVKEFFDRTLVDTNPNSCYCCNQNKKYHKNCNNH